MNFLDPNKAPVTVICPICQKDWPITLGERDALALPWWKSKNPARTHDHLWELPCSAHASLIQETKEQDQLVKGELSQLVQQSGAITEWLQSFKSEQLSSEQLLLVIAKIEFDNGKRLDRLIELLERR